MSEYLLLNIAVVGILVAAALLVVGTILLGRIVTLVYRANRRLVMAEMKNQAANVAYWDSLHTYWAALDAVRMAGVRS
ncbi:hypothetical protein EV140_1962 [Microcella alkaliphila]|uniref:Uncharacterized protein n=1 Tax=Microcella alkaliphila TaxID=279828 RepID=A0A4Q7THA0_9MICO|nr:hypothetical protein [Microcella alkaliphila]RZT59357.1 hypothetical protein EV140_1962 [Microcella alkaliphila]